MPKPLSEASAREICRAQRQIQNKQTKEYENRCTLVWGQLIVDFVMFLLCCMTLSFSLLKFFSVLAPVAYVVGVVQLSFAGYDDLGAMRRYAVGCFSGSFLGACGAFLIFLKVIDADGEKETESVGASAHGVYKLAYCILMMFVMGASACRLFAGQNALKFAKEMTSEFEEQVSQVEMSRMDRAPLAGGFPTNPYPGLQGGPGPYPGSPHSGAWANPAPAAHPFPSGFQNANAPGQPLQANPGFTMSAASPQRQWGA